MTLIQWNTLKCHAASAPGPVAQGSSKFSGSLCQLLSSRAWNDIGILAVKTFRRHKQLVTVFWRVRHLITSSSFFRITLDRLGVSWSFSSRRYPDSCCFTVRWKKLHRKPSKTKVSKGPGLSMASYASYAVWTCLRSIAAPRLAALCRFWEALSEALRRQALLRSQSCQMDLRRARLFDLNFAKPLFLRFLSTWPSHRCSKIMNKSTVLARSC